MPTLLTLCESLAPTRSSPSNSLKWTPNPNGGPVLGALVIEVRRRADAYQLTEFPTTWGRGFVLTKFTRGTDVTEPSYTVFASPHGAEHDSCSCKGSAATDGCKHRSAVRALISNGWL